MRSRKASPHRTARARRACPMIPRSGAGLGASSSACCVGWPCRAGPCEQTFSALLPSLPGIFRRPAVFCAWRPTHHECPHRRRVTQAADSVVGLPGESTLAARQAHRSRASDGSCPLHADRRPSLLVDPGKSLFYCYGCGRGGDVIRFVELFHGVRFGEALAVLRRWSGVGSLLSGVVHFYQLQLQRHPEAVAYLAQRGVHQPELVERMRIGYRRSRDDDQSARPARATGGLNWHKPSTPFFGSRPAAERRTRIRHTRQRDWKAVHQRVWMSDRGESKVPPACSLEDIADGYVYLAPIEDWRPVTFRGGLYHADEPRSSGTALAEGTSARPPLYDRGKSGPMAAESIRGHNSSISRAARDDRRQPSRRRRAVRCGWCLARYRNASGGLFRSGTARVNYLRMLPAGPFSRYAALPKGHAFQKRCHPALQLSLVHTPVPPSHAGVTQKSWGDLEMASDGIDARGAPSSNVLEEVPKRETFHQADVLMEGLRNLSPRRLQLLLLDCRER